MGEVEHHAHRHAVTLGHLATRAGVPAFGGGPSAEHWFAKSLT